MYKIHNIAGSFVIDFIISKSVFKQLSYCTKLNFSAKVKLVNAKNNKQNIVPNINKY